MKKRTYNPLTEGYSGQNMQRGYTGSSLVSSAPKTIPPIQSAVTKPNTVEKSKSKSSEK